MLAPSSVPPRLLGALLLGGAAAVLVSLPIAGAMLAAQPSPTDPCAVAFDPSAVPPHDRGLVARRLLACSDVTHGRITADEYHQQLATIDRAWTVAPPPPAPPAPPATQWASSVRGVSTQYTTASWSANRALGAPDVFPGSGDNQNAWAALGADDHDEWIEVGFAQPSRVSAAEIYETYNPGAISSIELTTTSGKTIVAYQGSPHATGLTSNKLRAEVGCTAEPIAAVTVRLASTQVAGWNELDAIGLVPCAEQ